MNKPVSHTLKNTCLKMASAILLVISLCATSYSSEPRLGKLNLSSIVAGGLPLIHQSIDDLSSTERAILQSFLTGGLSSVLQQQEIPSQSGQQLIENLLSLEKYAHGFSQSEINAEKLAAEVIHSFLKGEASVYQQYDSLRAEWYQWLQAYWSGLNGGDMPVPFNPETLALAAAYELLANAYVGAADIRAAEIDELISTQVLSTIPVFSPADIQAFELTKSVEALIKSGFEQSFGAIPPVPYLEPPALQNNSSPSIHQVAVEKTGAQLSVYDYPGKGQPIILLHGGPGSAHYLQWVAEYLNSHGRRVIRFDQRNTGGSSISNNDYSVAAYLNDFEAIREFSGAEQVDVFGHSWGGLYAQLVANDSPQTIGSLFLSNSTELRSYANPTGTSERVLADMKKLGVLDAKRYITYAVGFQATARQQLALPEDQQNWQAADYFFQLYNSPSAKVFVKDMALSPPSTAESRSGISGQAYLKTATAMGRFAADPSNDLILLVDKLSDKSITVFYGEQGDIIGEDSNKVLALFPQDKGSIKHIEARGVGHAPWLENPEVFMDALNDHFKL